MRFFTVYEIFKSIILSVFAGFLFGGLYCVSENIFTSIKKTILIIPHSIKLLSDFSLQKAKMYIRKEKKVKLNIVTKNIFEAIIFLVIGIFTIILFYISLDGIVRIYVILITATFFLITKKFIGKFFSFVFERIFGVIYSILLIPVCVLLFPIYKILGLTKKLIVKMLAPIKSYIEKNHSKNLVQRKLFEIEKILR